MILLVVAVLIGLVAGMLRAPLGARAARIRIERLPILAIGAAGIAVARLVSDEVAPLAMGLSLAVLLGFVLSNAHITGVIVIGVGLLLNLVAVVINDGIPVRGDALVTAGVVDDEADLATTELDGPRHLETDTDRLGVLGDVLPVPIARTVLSFGDLIVIAGVADAMRDLARRRRRAWSNDDRGSYGLTMTQLKAVHDWGTAPSAAPESGSQYSPNPDRTEPVTIDLTSSSATARSRPLVAASDNK